MRSNTLQGILDNLVEQALFTTREEADEYIKQCKEVKVEINPSI